MFSERIWQNQSAKLEIKSDRIMVVVAAGAALAGCSGLPQRLDASPLFKTGFYL